MRNAWIHGIALDLGQRYAWFSVAKRRHAARIVLALNDVHSTFGDYGNGFRICFSLYSILVKYPGRGEMKNLGLKLVSMLGGALLCLTAHAAGFTGYYDISNWTQGSTYGYPIVYSVDPTRQVLTIMEPDNATTDSGPGGSQSYDFSRVVETAGTVSFDWSFDATIDPCCSGLNFYVNGTLYNLANGSYPDPGNWDDGTVASGNFSIAVNAGDTIKFEAFSSDGCCQASTNVISNFQAPGGVTSIPTLSEWGMIILSSLLAMATIVTLRRQRL